MRRAVKENTLSGRIIGCCIAVHRDLGPGLLESAHEEALVYELGRQNLECTRQRGIPIHYRNIELNSGFRADVIVDDEVLIELKSVERLLSVHYKQVLTYLKLSGLKLGLLVNFNTPLIKDGIKRIVNNL